MNSWRVWPSTQVLHRFKCWEREVDTKSHTQPRKYLQLTTDREERSLLPQWSLIGFINHTPGVANTTWTQWSCCVPWFYFALFCHFFLSCWSFVYSFLIFIFVFTWGLVCVSYFFGFVSSFVFVFWKRQKEKKKLKLGVYEGGKDLAVVGGEENVIKIYCIKIIFQKNK